MLFLSVSTPEGVFYNEVMFLPDRIYLKSYADIFERSRITTFYFNTVWIVTTGTAINLVLTCLAAYPLSRRDFRLRNVFMAFIVFTMFFHGGIIPFYMVVRSLGLLNSRWSLVLPFAVFAWHIIITRTYYQSAYSRQPAGVGADRRCRQAAHPDKHRGAAVEAGGWPSSRCGPP